jgi:hypothetical protein
VIIQKDSWHYKLVTKHSGQFFDFERSCYDSCSYVRRVVWAMLRTLLIILAWGIGLGITVGDFLAWVAAMLVTGLLIDIRMGSVIVISVAGGVVFLTMCSGIVYLRNRWFPRASKRPPGFVHQAYVRARDKYCSKLEVV